MQERLRSSRSGGSCWNCRKRRNSRMRFLLISDTHGNLGIVNALAARVQADAVIHAGDFGFYDDGSYDRLSEREIGLQIMHSGLPRDEKTRMMMLPRSERIVAARAARLLGEFQAYVDGAASICVPVYADRKSTRLNSSHANI